MVLDAIFGEPKLLSEANIISQYASERAEVVSAGNSLLMRGIAPFA